MKKNLSIWTKIACLMVGLLKECGEASFCTLKKYMSAFTLLGVIWGTIGYLFSKMYMRIEPLFPKLIVSFVFIVMVLCIERFIILKIGNSKIIAWMRVIIASLMAILGATLIDQMIFKNDITNAMKIENVKKANEEIELRTINYDLEYAKLVYQRDSVSKELTMNNEKLLQNPFLKTVNYTSNRKIMGTDSLGTPIYAYETQANEQTIENPLAKQVEADRKCFENYQDQLDKITERIWDKLQIVQFLFSYSHSKQEISHFSNKDSELK